jgi:chromate transporter
VTAFGGPAAHMAMMEHEVVRRRHWLTREQFLDFVGAANLLPGPNSTEVALHVGRERGGWGGMLIAGAAFILPSAILVGVLAWVYVRFGALPEATGVLYGVKPVVIAIMVQALWRLGRTAVRSPSLAAVGLAVVVAAALGAGELLLLAAAGIVAAVAHRGFRARTLPLLLLVPGAATGLATQGTAVTFSLGTLFVTFLKIGSVLFGSGYVLLAFLRADFVERLGWLTGQQLLDAVAIGQVTPGPLFTTATFIGFLLAGTPGAIVATVAIFLPAFVFVAASGPLIPRIRRSPTAGAVLDGVTVASLGLMAVVTWQLGRDAIADLPTLGIAVTAAAVLFAARINSAWLILAGGLLGAAMTHAS